jgi:hypothetical protein
MGESEGGWGWVRVDGWVDEGGGEGGEEAPT